MEMGDCFGPDSRVRPWLVCRGHGTLPAFLVSVCSLGLLSVAVCFRHLNRVYYVLSNWPNGENGA